jgi:protein tyrosine phosphatase (PTP) superfamily phosphohydrolase (DUF442 family)
MRRLAWIVMAAALAAGCSRRDEPAPTPPGPAQAAYPEKVEAKGLHKVFRLNERLYSGSSPEGGEGFRSLRDLGVKTVISVDGARPDAELARQYGLRYVHLPIGYDGVPEARALRLARAVRDLPGPVYLHCHHGKHRGPAAAAVVQRCLDSECSAAKAVAWMRQAGTDPHYAGLYAAPERFRPLTGAELDRVSADFPESAPVTALAGLMVTIDERWDHLKEVRAAGWKVPRDHPDLDPAHEALLLGEGYREASRLPQVQDRPEELRRWLAEAERGAKELEDILRRGIGELDYAAEKAYQRAGAACARCHAKYRDVPQQR